MATKAQVKKIAVVSNKGRVNRSETVEALLAKFGAMTDLQVAENLARVDSGIDPDQVGPGGGRFKAQTALYQVRNRGKAEKQDDGLWHPIK